MTKVLSIASALALCAVSASGQTLQTNLASLAELEAAVSSNSQCVATFQLTGIVCAAIPRENAIVLEDESSAAFLRLPASQQLPSTGDRISLAGQNCPIARKQFEIQLGPEPLVDNDGDHPSLLASGQVFLPAGLQPIRVAWFNADASPELHVEFEGPGIRRGPIPNSILRRIPAGATNSSQSEPGLDFVARLGVGWNSVGDSRRFSVVRTGVATNFDVFYRARDEQTGLVFTGYLEARHPGFYTFYVQSAGGSQLTVGRSADFLRLEKLSGANSPRVTQIDSAAADNIAPCWSQCAGTVEFSAQRGAGWELELNGQGKMIHATVLDAQDLAPTNFLHRNVQITGVFRSVFSNEKERAPSVIVPSAREVELAPKRDPRRFSGIPADAALTTAEEVLRLKPEDALKRLRARLRGVVTWASTEQFVLQDATAGVFINYKSFDASRFPRVGEEWEVKGFTDPGDFSPVVNAGGLRWLGAAVPPRPIQPTWDQLNNGSLDAQYVEISGVVTGFSGGEVNLLTENGKIRIKTDPADVPRWMARQDDLVRVRGCLFAGRDDITHHVMGGHIRLGSAAISVEEARPQDPFSMPIKSVADLLLFDPRASALQRVRVKGQIIYVRPRECFLSDGRNGLRLATRNSMVIEMGDLAEAVGFVNLTGPVAVLDEAVLRKTGQAPLPDPVDLQPADLEDRKHDSTLVRIDAAVMNDSANRGRRVLELQAGSHHFLASLKPRSPDWEFLSAGTRVRLTGIYSAISEDRAEPNLDSFEILVPDSADIAVIEQGPWWTAQRAGSIVLALCGVLVAAWIWIALLKRKIQTRTAQLEVEIHQRQALEHTRAVEKERARVAQDLHDELGAGLTEVSFLGSLAKNPSLALEKRERYLDQLTDASRSLVTSLDEIVWAVNPDYDSVESLATYYALFAERFLKLAGISCRLEIPEKFPELPMDSKTRHGVFLAFKEALNNVVRHSGATEAQLEIRAGTDLTISILDNGRGFEMNGSIPGKDGIAGMISRMRKLGGSCYVESRPGAGTRVVLKLPMEGLS